MEILIAAMQIIKILTSTGLTVYDLVQKLRDDPTVQNVPTDEELKDSAKQVREFILPG